MCFNKDKCFLITYDDADKALAAIGITREEYLKQKFFLWAETTQITTRCSRKELYTIYTKLRQKYTNIEVIEIPSECLHLNTVKYIYKEELLK